MTSVPGKGADSFFVPRELAASGSLASHLLAGDPRFELPLLRQHPDAAPRESGAARLAPEAFGASGPEAAAKLERVLGGEGYFVTTGHQPILFLGPLYVLHKAITAIELAAYLERSWRVPVLPLFWVASDDHDWDEVGSTAVLDEEHRVVKLSVQIPQGAGHRSVGPTSLGHEIESIVDRFVELLPKSQFKAANVQLIRDAYRAEATFAGAFAELLRSVLGDREYAWLDSAGMAVKRAACPLYDRMLQEPQRILAAQSAGAANIEDAGFAAPIGGVMEALPLFVDSGEGRARLFVDANDGRAGRDGDVEPIETWRNRLESQPEIFSPNVSSRPVLESYLLPVAATVLGPGEIAYWSQLAALFQALETPFPWVQPRAAWNIVEPNIRRPLDRLGLELATLSDGGDEAIRGLTAASRPEEVDAQLRRLQGTLEEAISGLEKAIGAALPGLKGAAGRTRKGIFDAVEKLERQVNQQTRGRLDVEIAQVRRCAASLFPDRKPQERVLSPFPFLARHGTRLIDELAEETARWIADSLAGPVQDG